MGWKQWAAVVVLIGGGVLLQIPGHDDEASSKHADSKHAAMSAGQAEPQGPYATIALEVTGMT
jgi:hypothetical protein